MTSVAYTPEIVSELRADLLEDWIVTGLVALVAFDYVITMDQEVNMVWRRKWTAATWLFISNRYLLVLVMVLANVHATATTCSGVEITLSTLETAQYLIFSLFSALRVYGLLSRTAFAVFMMVLVFCLNLVPLATGILFFAKGSPFFFQDPVFGSYCSFSDTQSASASLQLINFASSVSIASRVPVIAADIIVLFVTWMKTAKQARHASLLQMGVSLSETLLRDGSVYFLILLGLNIAQMVVTVVPGLNEIDLFTQINQVVTPVFISRFLLNLREAMSPDQTPAATLSDFEAAEFRRPTMSSFVGNMGGSLDHGLGPDEDDTELQQEQDSNEAEDIEGTALDSRDPDEGQHDAA